ncbi:hypothetical protein Cyagr_3055 [Cyanobium gracile PCC 6307]|uniref:Uncharacterized protein n=1 Tax=Cyanobium gracile (strain ATCC 27147 / PCC 6307) TaxID=292564 RepID=K9P9R6_CYAGP|nr:hypothetical protein Cyagr_3055 [Cyanobium gracile PCC 6307]
MQHEQSFADSFNSFMRSKAQQYGCSFHSFSVDGQDRDAGSDYVLTDANRFAMVEFKYTSRDLLSEKNKPRRLVLCKKLLARDDMRILHDKCHFVSWTEPPTMSVRTNIYRHEICTRAVFGAHCGLEADLANDATRAQAAVFAEEFFSGAGIRSLSLNDFQTYVAWVMAETSASSNTTLELLTHDPSAKELTLVRFSSLSQAHSWVQSHLPPPPTRRRGHSHGI